jgi:hypothetical protein
MSQEVTDADLCEDRLVQGDILRLKDCDPVDRAEYGIVVTADCDLLHNKVRGIVSYVPLLRLETYVSNVWGPDYVSRRVQKILEGVIGRVRDAHKARETNQTLSEQAIRDWLVRDDAAEIASQLLGADADAKKQDKLVRVISTGREALLYERRLSVAETEMNYIHRLTAAATTLFPDGKGNAKTILSALDGYCNSLPGDVFFVSQLPNEGESGYFALLRHIRQCELEDISLDAAERPGPIPPARRIGTLRSPFIYALTKQMTNVFADIGLPTYHSKRLSACVKTYLSGAEE